MLLFLFFHLLGKDESFGLEKSGILEVIALFLDRSTSIIAHVDSRKWRNYILGVVSS